MRPGYSVRSLALALVAKEVGSCAESFGPLGVFARIGEGGSSSPSPSRKASTSLASSSSSSSTSPLTNRVNPLPLPLPQQRLEELGLTMLLKHTTDNYDGVTVDEAGLPDSVEGFISALTTSLEAWRSAGKKGVWLKVPADRTELVPISLDLGFELHHAEKAYIMLNTWLPPTTNQLPANASHQVGVGALVLNDQGDVLVVREMNGPLRGTGIWKLPTGLIDAGEDLPDAAAREVLEETGVETEFDSVLAFRHGHRGLFGKSDLFFVVRMRLKADADPSALRPQESEIEDCQWMPRSLFTQQNSESGTVLQRELNKIMEAHLASEAAAGSAQLDDPYSSEGLEDCSQGPGWEEQGSGGKEEGARRRRHAGVFTGKMLESSRKYGGKSMLYHGKL